MKFYRWVVLPTAVVLGLVTLLIVLALMFIVIYDAMHAEERGDEASSASHQVDPGFVAVVEVRVDLEPGFRWKLGYECVSEGINDSVYQVTDEVVKGDRVRVETTLRHGCHLRLSGPVYLDGDTDTGSPNSVLSWRASGSEPMTAISEVRVDGKTVVCDITACGEGGSISDTLVCRVDCLVP